MKTLFQIGRSLSLMAMLVTASASAQTVPGIPGFGDGNNAGAGNAQPVMTREQWEAARQQQAQQGGFNPSPTALAGSGFYQGGNQTSMADQRPSELAAGQRAGGNPSASSCNTYRGDPTRLIDRAGSAERFQGGQHL